MLKPSISGEVVHHTRDRMGPILVLDTRRHRILTFDSVFEQSKIDRRRPWLPVHEYNRAMLLPLAWARPSRAAVLGVGGGTLVGALHHLCPDCRVKAVDLRQEVVQVARDYFSLPRSSNIDVVIADARDALENMEEGSLDLILADLYSADRMSPAQAKRHFVDLCRQVLSPRGWLVINYHQPPESDSRLFRHLRLHFASLFCYTSKTNNTIVLASRQPVAAMDASSPVLGELQRSLPIGWRKMMAKVRAG